MTMKKVRENSPPPAMNIPNGLTESEVLDIIRKTVSYLAPSFKFGYFDADDMKQEGAIFCIEALPSFNFDKSVQDDVGDALLTFLKTHVRWRFLNMRRKQLMRVEPPLCRCELCQTDAANRLDCRKYSNWIKRNISKRTLMEPFNVDDIYTTDASTCVDVDSGLLSVDIKRILNEHISVHFRVDYRRFIEGAKLPKHRKEKLIKEIMLILSEHYSSDIFDWRNDENG